LELHIAEAQSLKDKRQVLRSLKDRLRAHFNVAVAELDFEDTWQRSVVGVVTLSNEAHHVEEGPAEGFGGGRPDPRAHGGESCSGDSLNSRKPIAGYQDLRANGLRLMAEG